MKNQMLNLSYTEKENTKDLRTVATSAETPSFIVDKQLIDILLGLVVTMDLPSIKQSLQGIIEISDSMPVIIERIEEFFYMHKIAGKLEELKAEDKPGYISQEDKRERY